MEASLRDLAALPGNRFEALVDRKGQYSNNQWRICFEGRRIAGTIKRGDC
jgi:plasmid maintenance system killer protein